MTSDTQGLVNAAPTRRHAPTPHRQRSQDRPRQPIRLHDLRATFVTVSLASGRTEQWVTDRMGQKSSAMVALYARRARPWSELNLGTLGPLDELPPEVPTNARADGSPPAADPDPGQAIGPRLDQDGSHPRELNPRPTVYETVALPLS